MFALLVAWTTSCMEKSVISCSIIDPPSPDLFFLPEPAILGFSFTFQCVRLGAIHEIMLPSSSITFLSIC